MNNIKFISPFKRLCVSVGNLPTAYLESMSYYECLTYFMKFLENEVIPAINNNSEVVKELQEKFNLLKEYVDTYFDNLDVQTEINNKLDDMAEHGELAEVMAQYLNATALIKFDSIDDMKESETLADGMIVQCYGLEELNDGSGGYFKILTTGTADEKYIITLQNGLKAHLINYFMKNYYNITYTVNRAHDTDYYLTTIPLNDEYGNMIKLEVEKDNVSPLLHAQKEYTSFTCNATVPIQDTDDEFHETLVIGNGEILNPAYNFDISVPDYYQYLCIDDERNVTSYQANITDSSTLLANGIKQAFLVYFKLITSGNLDLPTGSILLTRAPRQMIGVKADKTMIILTSDGYDGFRNKGLTLEEGANILLAQGCVEAWNLDGGGSTSTIIKGSKINRNIDDNFTTDRMREYTLNAKRVILDKNTGDINNIIGEQKQLLNKQLIDFISAKYSPSLVNIAFPGYTLTTTASYEKITLSINQTINSDITYDSDNKELKLNKGTYLVNGNFYIQSTASENKFSACYLNGTQLTLESISASATDRIQFNFDYILEVSSDNSTFDVRVYGTTGDAIQRGSLNIQKLA